MSDPEDQIAVSAAPSGARQDASTTSPSNTVEKLARSATSRSFIVTGRPRSTRLVTPCSEMPQGTIPRGPAFFEPLALSATVLGVRKWLRSEVTRLVVDGTGRVFFLLDVDGRELVWTSTTAAVTD